MRSCIEKNCLTVTGNLNNRVIDKNWWIKRNFLEQYDNVLHLTNSLGDIAFSQRLWHVFNNTYTIPKCSVCQTNTNFKRFSDGFYTLCSKSCVTQCESRNKKISQNRDMVAISAKVKETNTLKYGTANFFETDEFKTRSALTKLTRYNNVNYNNIDKIKKTNIDRYGSEHFLSSDTGKKLLRDKILCNQGSLKLDTTTNETINNIEYLTELNAYMSITDIAELVGVTPKTITNKLQQHNITINRFASSKQKMQSRLYDDITCIYSGEVVQNDRTIISPKEIDIYIPEYRLAIELNGMYWHSETSNSGFRTKHLDKLNKCNALGITLLQFTDIEYRDNPDLVMSVIKNKLNIKKITLGARKCEVVRLDKKYEKLFLVENHFQGYVPSKYCYALMYNGNIVQIMSFGKSRYSLKAEYELLRLCSHKDYVISGGAEKLLSSFKKEISPKSIISYCDISKFSGTSYTRLGFNNIGRSIPNYWYFKSGKVLSRAATQKHKLKAILENFDETLSESENMFVNGWRRYWNCGNDVYLLE